jgi:pimeloyl-ACP methyl ester carboxylesterase
MMGLPKASQEVPMPELVVNGVRLHYVEQGSGPETVVFSHSYLVDHRHFEPQIAAASARYRVVAYDHRGHGQSEKPTVGYEMENLYADGVAFLEAMECVPCHWVGLSTGGFVGLRIAIRRPELLRSLVLMDTSADREPRANRIRLTLMLSALRLFGFKPVIGSAMAAMFAPKFLRDPDRRVERDMWKRRMMANDKGSIIRFGRGIVARTSVYEQLGRIQAPTLMVAGEQDAAIPPSKARRIAEGIPGARLEIIPDGGHLCTIEEPEAVNTVLSSFLDAHAETLA